MHSKYDDILDQCATIALKSIMLHKHGCIIKNKNKIISHGYNRVTTGFKDQYSIHAEVDAILKAKNIIKNLEECELYVVRIGNDYSKIYNKSTPCIKCIEFIKKYKIYKVYHT